MKLLFILPEFEPDTSGGICAYYKNLMSELIKYNNLQITIIQGSAYETRGTSSNWKGINLHYLSVELFKTFQNKFSHLDIYPELRNHLASAWAMYDMANSLNISFDQVICTDWGLGFVPWIIENKIPTSVHLHGSIGQIEYYEPKKGLEFWSSLTLQIESDLLNFASNIVTHSNDNINFWENRLVKNIKLIAPVFQIIENQPNFSIVEDANISALVLARIQYWKGPIDLCEALLLLKDEERKKLKILWAGRDTIYEEKGISMDLYLTQKYPNIWRNIIIPIGIKTKDELKEIYQQIDFSIVPSNWDMFNMAAVEHLLNEKPLICSRKAGVASFLNHSYAIQITDSIESLAHAIRANLNLSKTELAKNGNLAKQLALKIFDKENILNEHLSSFNQELCSDNQNLRNKYAYLIPQTIETLDSKTKLLETWKIKEIGKILFKRLKKKIFNKCQQL